MGRNQQRIWTAFWQGASISVAVSKNGTGGWQTDISLLICY